MFFEFDEAASVTTMFWLMVGILLVVLLVMSSGLGSGLNKEQKGSAMHADLGGLFPVSRLTLGGGGIGQVWGPTSREEAVAVVRAAYEAGITCFDMAPLYGRGEAEEVMGEAFADGYPEDVRVTTKCMLGTVPEEQVLPKFRASLRESCERMKRQHIDLFVLHGHVVPDGFSGGPRAALLPRIAVPETLYKTAVIDAMRALVGEGVIGGWAITAAGPLDVNLRALQAASPKHRPDAIQCITNLLDSPGSMMLEENCVPEPRKVLELAHSCGVGVMGIRAVAAGALTDGIDRDVEATSAEQRDFERAQDFRALAARWGLTPALLAHRYALSMSGVNTVVLGVKNRTELEECLSAEAAGTLSQDEMAAIDRAVAM